MALKSLNKYPPALGMAGTVMGMVTLFSNLDTSKDKIGISLSIAMTATFFGLILSNMLISPLADRFQILQASNLRITDNLYEVILSGESLHKIHQAEEHTWAVSYADFLMVLLSFFIIFCSQNDGAENVIFKITQELTKNSGQQGSSNQTSTAPKAPGKFAGKYDFIITNFGSVCSII